MSYTSNGRSAKPEPASRHAVPHRIITQLCLLAQIDMPALKYN